MEEPTVVLNDGLVAKGKHHFIYDPTGFSRTIGDRSPVLSVDEIQVFVDESLVKDGSGISYLVCECQEYLEKKKTFETKKIIFPYLSDLTWDQVSGCNDCGLINAYFGPLIVKKTLDKILREQSDRDEAFRQLIRSREGSMFLKAAGREGLKYLKGEGRYNNQFHL